MVWNRASQSVEVVVMRPSSSKPVKLTMVADELEPASYNWQVLFHLFACWFLYRNTG